MKTVRIIAASLALLLALSACTQVKDCLRRAAGRPTSADIAVKKARIDMEEAAHQARLDSLRAYRKAVADSLELLDRIKASRTMMMTAGSVRGLIRKGLQYRYYVVIGTFGSPANAKAQAARASAAGHASAIIPFNNGFSAVGIDGSDTLAAIWESLQQARTESFCPKDVWILVNE
ncbi:MAG: SPOR domain-containing protein [Bacteroidales bacterium]|nr:SPOR domain-containing protein [Bacteroidales bacterium]